MDDSSHADRTELTDRQRQILDFERTWWQLDEPRDEAIRARFGCVTDDYYAELDEVLAHPGAMAHDPLVVRRFERRRLRRRRTLIEGAHPTATTDITEDTADSPREQAGEA